ncbi:MAG: M1 family metallopeptidase [Balneolales bacterium]|nr:M1 family metallopeptidase [Balneolales bacterium]
MFKLPQFLYLILFTLPTIALLSGCTTSEKASSKSDPAISGMEIHSERPIPYPIDIPEEFLRALENGTRTADGSPGDSFWQNYARYDINAELDPKSKLLEGHMQAVYFNNSPEILNTLHMELALNVHKKGVVRARSQQITGGKEITYLSVNGQELQRSDRRNNAYNVDGTRLIIYPGSSVVSGDSVVVELRWTAKIPQRGASGRNGWDDDLFFLGYWYPQFSVFDDVYGWFTEPFLGNAEFYHGFADYNLNITMPDDWVVMATGEFLNPQETLAAHVYDRYLQAKNSDEVIHVIKKEDFRQNATAESQNGTHTWKFASENVRDVAVSATRKSFWDARRTSVGDLNGDGQMNYSLMNAFYREAAPLWREVAEYNAHAITFLSEMTGFPYPWPHMTSVEGANIIGGGMEYPMMTLMGDYNQRGAMALYSVTAHELAHMWFPLIVSTNERIYTWIDEGNTVFATDEARKNRFPHVDKHAGTQAGYINFARTGREGELMRWSDFHYSTNAYRVASYPKPASILVALREVIGEDVFWDAYRTIVDEWAFKQMYPWDMFNIFERVSGKDLSWFWRAWYYEKWTLNQSVKSVREDNGHTIVTIQDRGNVPMPVLLQFTLSDGEKKMERVEVEHWLRGNRTMEIHLPYSNITQVEIDPERHFPDIDRTNMSWTN